MHAMEEELAKSKTVKKELEQLQRQRVDLLDKSEEYRDQVKANEQLSHELKHLTAYFKDGQRQISQLEAAVEEFKAKEQDHEEVVKRLNEKIATQNQQIATQESYQTDSGVRQLKSLLDQKCMLLEQARLKSEADER